MVYTHTYNLHICKNFKYKIDNERTFKIIMWLHLVLCQTLVMYVSDLYKFIIMAVFCHIRRWLCWVPKNKKAIFPCFGIIGILFSCDMSYMFYKIASKTIYICWIRTDNEQYLNNVSYIKQFNKEITLIPVINKFFFNIIGYYFYLIANSECYNLYSVSFLELHFHIRFQGSKYILYILL